MIKILYWPTNDILYISLLLFSDDFIIKENSATFQEKKAGLHKCFW